MAENVVTQEVHKRLSITREAEFLQSYVRINVQDEDEEEEAKDNTDPINQEPITSEDKKVVVLENGTDMITEEVTKKIKKKRRRSKREELYCDKDRAAAVNLGSKDIKQSLKLKRKQDRSKILQIPEEAEPATFLALGNYEMGRGDLRISLNFISKVHFML